MARQMKFAEYLQIQRIMTYREGAMRDFNTYLQDVDFSVLQQLFQERGEKRVYRKKEFFIQQHTKSRFLGWIERGTFQYRFIDSEGAEHIVGYAFENEFVGDYSSFLKGIESLVGIQALTECIVYRLARNEMIGYWDTDLNTQKYGRLIAESLYGMAYKRILESYCSPEIRYRELMRRSPNLKENVSLKSIASYLGVTPETISHIRKKILLEKKS